MQDCRLIVTVRNDKVDFEGQDISVMELAQIAGFLQVFVGMEGLKRGLDMDDVKGNMLDIHLAAMETLEEQLRQCIYYQKHEKKSPSGAGREERT